MRSYSVVFSDNARSDLYSIAEYIANDNPKRARSFVGGLRKKLESQLSDFPFTGEAVEGTPFRRKVVGNYIAIYRIESEASRCTIVLVSEGHRDWRRLLEGLE